MGTAEIIYLLIFLVFVLPTMGLLWGKDQIIDKIKPRPIIPLPPLPEIDILDEKVKIVLNSRVRNPRLIKERKRLLVWEQAFYDLQPDEFDDEDEETIRAWEGTVLRGACKTHGKDEECHRCDSRKWGRS